MGGLGRRHVVVVGPVEEEEVAKEEEVKTEERECIILSPSLSLSLSRARSLSFSQYTET